VTVSERTIGKRLRKTRLLGYTPGLFIRKGMRRGKRFLKKIPFPSQESLIGVYRRDQCRDLVPGWLSAEEAINEWGRRYQPKSGD
jgi:hypothetical protein